MEQRFSRNIPTISEAEQSILRQKRVAIIGCGGLGGYLAEFMARVGVGAITVVDGDSFEETNLNRQNLSLPALIGRGKAEALGNLDHGAPPLAIGNTGQICHS